MKKLLFLLGLFLQITTSYSQDTRSTYFTRLDSSYMYNTSSIEWNEHFLYVTYNGYTNSAALRKIDKKGVLVSEDSLTSFPVVSYWSQLLNTTTGYIVAFCKNNDVNNFSHENTDVMVRSYDMNNQLLFETEIISPHEDLLEGIIETQDGGFLIYSRKYDTDVSPAQTKFFLTKLDTNGAFLWEKLLDESFGFNELVELVSGQILITGKNNLTGLKQNTLLSSEGIVLQEYTFSNYLSPIISKIIPLNASEVLMIGSRKLVDTLEFYQGLVYKMTIDGTLLDSTFFSLDESTDFFDAVKNETGNVVIVGGTGTGTYPWQSVNYTRRPVLIALNDNNEILWQRNYYLDSNYHRYQFGRIIQTNDKGYLVSSQIRSRNYQTHKINAGLIKLDCIGCDSLLCYYKDTICNPADCERYANDYKFTATIDSNLLELNKIHINVLNNSSELASCTWFFGDGYTAPASILTSSFDYLYDEPGYYEIQLIFSKGICNDTSKIGLFVGAGLGLEQAEKFDFSLHPNPNNGNFTLKQDFNTKINLSIKNLLNQEVYFQHDVAQQENIDLALKSGIYLVTIENEGKTYQQKMVVR